MSQVLVFDRPPIQELGFTAIVPGGPVYDPFDVKSVHQVFSDDYPMVQRAMPAGVSVAPIVGGGGAPPETYEIAPGRWWFGAADESTVLQLQDEWFAVNWRRQSGPFEDPKYLGYETMRSKFDDAHAKLSAWHQSRGGEIGLPSGCELLYDNIIPLQTSGGDTVRLSEILSEFQSMDPGSPRSAFHLQWMERIADSAEDRSVMSVSIQAGGLVVAGKAEPLPILRCMFIAGAARDSWAGVFDFFDMAHERMRSRFLGLISADAQARWSRV